MDKRSIKRAAQSRAIQAIPLPKARALLELHEHILLRREVKAAEASDKAKLLRQLADLTDLTDREQRDLQHCEAIMASARQSRMSYEADMRQSKPFVPCGPPRAIQGSAYYSVLKANRDPAAYMAAFTEDGYYSHTVGYEGPAKVDGIQVMSDRLPGTDCLARAELGKTAALRAYTQTMAKSAARAETLASRSHRKTSKRGRRRRGKGS